MFKMKKIFPLFIICLVLIHVRLFAQATSCNCYLPLDTSFHVVPMTNGTDAVTPPYYYNNVNTSQAIKLPFSFCFYGKSYDTVYIGNKGNISFIKPIFNSGNFSF